MLGEHSRDRRRDTTATRGRQHEVADLDDPPLRVEVMERAAADDLAALGVGGGERQQAALLGELRQLAERSEQLFAIERGEVPRFAKLGIGERRQDPVDVLEPGKAQHDARA